MTVDLGQHWQRWDELQAYVVVAGGGGWKKMEDNRSADPLPYLDQTNTHQSWRWPHEVQNGPKCLVCLSDEVVQYMEPTLKFRVPRISGRKCFLPLSFNGLGSKNSALCHYNVSKWLNIDLRCHMTCWLWVACGSHSMK